jgi:hypothetical protein
VFEAARASEPLPTIPMSWYSRSTLSSSHPPFNNEIDSDWLYLTVVVRPHLNSPKAQQAVAQHIDKQSRVLI